MSRAHGEVGRYLILPVIACAALLQGCAGPVLGTGEGVAELEVHPDVSLAKFNGSPPPSGRSAQFGAKTWSIAKGRHEIEVVTSRTQKMAGGKMRVELTTAKIAFEVQADHRYFVTTGVVGSTLISDLQLRVVDRTDKTCWFGGKQVPTPCGEGRPAWAPRQ
jgi:hypothetical protein